MIFNGSARAVLFGGIGLLLIATAGMAAAMTMSGGMSMHRGDNGEDDSPVVSQASEVTVDIADFAYKPGNLTIAAGATVAWVNRDSAPHTATDRDETWDTGRLGKDEAKSISFDSPGQYRYYCVYHPNMKALLTVQ